MARFPLVWAGVGAVALAAILIGLHALAHHAHAQAAPACTAPTELARFTNRLPRTRPANWASRSSRWRLCFPMLRPP